MNIFASLGKKLAKINSSNNNAGLGSIVSAGGAASTISSAISGDSSKPVATDHTHGKNNNMINPNKFANQKIQELGQNLFQGEEFAQQIASKRLDQPLPPPGSAPQSPYGDINPIMNKESREARRQERKNIRMANKGLRQARRERAKGVKEQGQENYSYDGYEKGRYNKKGDDIEFGKTPRYSKKNPPSGSDASFGISGYVNDKKQFKSALNQNDPSSKAKPEKVRKQKEVAEVIPEKIYKKSGKRISRTPFSFDNPQYIVKKDPKYTYKKGDLMDETDFEKSSFNSSRSKGSVSFPDISTDDYSDIQEDKKSQYMTSLGSQDGEFYGDEKRPTSSTHRNFLGRTVDRDTLRPSQGKKFISTWKKRK